MSGALAVLWPWRYVEVAGSFGSASGGPHRCVNKHCIREELREEISLWNPSGERRTSHARAREEPGSGEKRYV